MSMKMLVPMEVGICCADLQALSQFYQDVLGFTFIAQVQMPAAAAQQVGLSEGGYSVVRLQTPYGERIKLLAPQRAPEPQAEGLILERRNASYLTFIVADIASLAAELRHRERVLRETGGRDITDPRSAGRLDHRPGLGKLRPGGA